MSGQPTHICLDCFGGSLNMPTADEVMREMIERRGLSYRDAITECDRLAEDAARPYRQVAEQLRPELGCVQEARDE